MIRRHGRLYDCSLDPTDGCDENILGARLDRSFIFEVQLQVVSSSTAARIMACALSGEARHRLGLNTTSLR
jgi:hypothetical protein